MVNWTRVYGSAGALVSSFALVGSETWAILESGGLKAFNPNYLSASLGNSVPLAYGYSAFLVAAMAGGIYGIAWSGRILHREISGSLKNYRAARVARKSKPTESAQSVLRKENSGSDVRVPHFLQQSGKQIVAEVAEEKYYMTGLGLPTFPKADSGDVTYRTLEEL